MPPEPPLQRDEKDEERTCQHNEIGDRVQSLEDVGGFGIGRRRNVDQRNIDQAQERAARNPTAI